MKRQHTTINRDNYEVWFIDYLDGQLTAAENEMLHNFLSEHADLAIELENMADMTLTATASIGFPNKALLKKASAPFSDLSAYDYQMVKAVEEGLLAPEHINMNSAAAQTDWCLYQKIKLNALPLAYPYKNKLLRKRLAFIPTTLRAVAAAILLLILFNVKDDMPEQFLGAHSFVVTETIPAIEQSPVRSPETPIRQVVPKSLSAPEYMATATHPTTEVAVAASEEPTSRTSPAALPAPKVVSLPTPSLPNSYETGLRLMLPKYVENHQLMASLSNQTMPQMAEPDTKTLLNRTTNLIKQVTPFNLTYNKVYDEDGELVAINLSGDNFEVAQRVPKWWGAK